MPSRTASPDPRRSTAMLARGLSLTLVIAVGLALVLAGVHALSTPKADPAAVARPATAATAAVARPATAATAAVARPATAAAAAPAVVASPARRASRPKSP